MACGTNCSPIMAAVKATDAVTPLSTEDKKMPLAVFIGISSIPTTPEGFKPLAETDQDESVKTLACGTNCSPIIS